MILNTGYQIVRTLRPRQWLKNLSVFAAPVFIGRLMDPAIFKTTIQAFVVFCAISSAGYIINDIVDAPKDRMHPVKKNRPIASGKLSELLAWQIAIMLIIGTTFFAFFTIGRYFTLAILAYISLQLLYSFYLRNVIILDALTVATLFIFRVFAGGFAAEISVSSWLILATIGLSLLLAFGKRRSEKTLLEQHTRTDTERIETRQTLQHYPDHLLDSMISTSASFCIITYSLFTFQISPENLSDTLMEILPSILRNPKFMMLTIPVVIYGVARYLYVIYEKKEGESPERVLLSDKPLLATVCLWGGMVLTIIYLLPSLG